MLGKRQCLEKLLLVEVLTSLLHYKQKNANYEPVIQPPIPDIRYIIFACSLVQKATMHLKLHLHFIACTTGYANLINSSSISQVASQKPVQHPSPHFTFTHTSNLISNGPPTATIVGKKVPFFSNFSLGWALPLTVKLMPCLPPTTFRKKHTS